jgi:hypothetical protein
MLALAPGRVPLAAGAGFFIEIHRGWVGKIAHSVEEMLPYFNLQPVGQDTAQNASPIAQARKAAIG